ncbi:MAG TPA: NUDIX hydrolase [Candidatus Nanoarchaeia archaeon]
MEQRGVTVDIVAVKNNKIALIKRGNEPFKGHWALPGGKVDVGETTQEAALRELKEESSLEGKVECLVGYYDNPDRDPNNNVTFAYAVSVRGELKAADDAVEAGWFGLDKLPPLAFDHQQIIEDFSTGYELVRQQK